MATKVIRTFIGSLEKGMKAMSIKKPTEGLYNGVDLKKLPKYICFQASHLKTKMTLNYIVLMLIITLLVVFSINRMEINSLNQKLREKEYILAPGVVDFTPASPQTISDSYLQSAVMDFLGQLGNINAINIEQQYRSLSTMMSPELKVRFLAEIADWISKVKADNITETLTITMLQQLLFIPISTPSKPTPDHTLTHRTQTTP